MSTWQQFADEAPELAAAVQARFAAERHHVLASLRTDGSPRVSGTEVGFRHGELFLGSMPGARKARDLQRDPRCAIHAHTGDGTMAGGDAKVAGRAVEALDDATLAAFHSSDQPPGPSHLFLLDLTEVVLTTVESDRLVVTMWHLGDGVQRVSPN